MAETYDVIYQDPREELGPDGRFHRVTHVVIQTKPNGVRGEFDVSQERYSAEMVRSMAEELASTLEAIATL